MLIADRGYNADAIRTDVNGSGSSVIPIKRDYRVQIPQDGFVYALCSRIERGIGRLKNTPRVTTRDDKTAASYLGCVRLAAIRLWLRHFVNTA